MALGSLTMLPTHAAVGLCGAIERLGRTCECEPALVDWRLKNECVNATVWKNPFREI